MRVEALAAAVHSKFAAAFVVLLLALTWTYPVTTTMIDRGDFPPHLEAAVAIAAAPSIPVPHFMFFVLVAALIRLSLSPQAAGIAVITGMHLLTAGAIWSHFQRHSARPLIAAVLVAVALLIVGPILPWFVEPDQFLIGYFSPNAVHNATFITAKPFALMVLFAGAAAFQGSALTWSAAGAGAIVLLSAIAKPNYLLCLIPALVLQAVWRRWRRQTVRWGVVVAMVAMAGTALLVMRQAYGAQGISVVVSPFAVMGLYTPVDASLAAKLLASIAFPLAVVMMWPGRLRAPEVSLAWLATVIALGQGYLLAEAGENIGDGNLLVGASLSVFVLFVVSANALLSLPDPQTLGEYAKRLAALAILALHVAGSYRYLDEFMGPENWKTPLSAVALAVMVVWMAALAYTRRGVVARANPRGLA